MTFTPEFREIKVTDIASSRVYNYIIKKKEMMPRIRVNQVQKVPELFVKF
jgi:hypothetical protein